MANLFTSQTPSITDASDGAPGITTATTVVFAEDGTVTGVRFYATSTVSGTYTAGLWTVDSSDAGTGTLLASKTMGAAPTGGTWNTVTFDTPVSVTASTVAYRVGIFSGAGRYVATVAFAEFAGGSGGLTNGDIFAPPNNDNPVGSVVIKQGAFTIDAAFSYPTGGSGGTCYFVDVEFTAGAAPTPISVGDAGAAAEALAVAAAVPLADASSAAEALAVAVASGVADSAAAADVLAVGAAVPMADTAAASESLTITAVITLADLAAAVDGLDNGSSIPKSLGDAGAAVERLRITTVRPNTGITTRPFTGITLRP